MQMLSATYGAKKTLSSQPLHILLSNIFVIAMHLLNQLVVAYATDSARAVMTPTSSPHQPPQMENPQRVKNLTHNKDNPTESDTNTASGKEEIATNDIAEVVYYKPSTDRES